MDDMSRYVEKNNLDLGALLISTFGSLDHDVQGLQIRWQLLTGNEQVPEAVVNSDHYLQVADLFNQLSTHPQLQIWLSADPSRESHCDASAASIAALLHDIGKTGPDTQANAILPILFTKATAECLEKQAGDPSWLHLPVLEVVQDLQQQLRLSETQIQEIRHILEPGWTFDHLFGLHSRWTYDILMALGFDVAFAALAAGHHNLRSLERGENFNGFKPEIVTRQMILLEVADFLEASCSRGDHSYPESLDILSERVGSILGKTESLTQQAQLTLDTFLGAVAILRQTMPEIIRAC